MDFVYGSGWIVFIVAAIIWWAYDKLRGKA